MSVIKSDSPTVQKVREIAEPMCEELGLYLWDVRYEKEGASWYLRIIIDKDGGVDMNDCEALHRPLSDKLDEIDPIKQSYIFEVSSPGLGRELRRADHFEVCIGDPIRIRFIRPRDGEKEILRVLLSCDKTGIRVSDENGNEERIEFSDCAKITLFDDEDIV